MRRALTIYLVTDGKPGHENQSLGLAEAISRLASTVIGKISVASSRHLFGRLAAAMEQARQMGTPDLIIGAGHATHPTLIRLSRRWNVPCVVLMKPSLPAAFFDLCLIPLHDLKARGPGSNVIPTAGALNRVPPPLAGDRQGKMILIGGPSSSHGWDEAQITAMVETIVRSSGWEATDSRRSPAGTLERLAARCPGLTVHPHADTGSGWLPSKLAAAAEVWVTEDSVSMIYEALSSGARVGLLPVPAIKADSRVIRGVRKLVKDGYVTPFSTWTPGAALPAPPEVLRESDRCARIVLERLFPNLLPAV